MLYRFQVEESIRDGAMGEVKDRYGKWTQDWKGKYRYRKGQGLN